ncbi:restriction endonuclease subunit R [Leptolyngbya sp. AN03gr2]|uniref:restriction endonuclease subunit R n=1 Tax=unclassified Leptolyngbya TaxID=2650499 RepID=UPI003D31FD88
MAQAVQARKVTLGFLETEFGLQMAANPRFFTEWIAPETQITDSELQALTRVKSNFEHLIKEPPILEEAVKMVVLSPLLDLSGFYQSPFRIKPEAEIEVEAIDNEDGVVIRGEIDVLVVSGQLWVLAIESKMSAFSLNVALPQALSYMLANPTQPCYGLILNGSDFVFVKLNREDTPQYATSRVFSLFAPGNELIEVLKILKHLAQLVIGG